MTDCTNVDIRDRLPDFVHGGLDAGSQAAVAAHVQGCAACADELALLRHARAAMRRAPSVDVARIVAALPQPTAVPRPELTLVDGGGRSHARRAGSWRARSWRPLAVAASLLVAGGITAVGVQRYVDGQDGNASDVAVVAPSPTMADDAAGTGVPVRSETSQPADAPAAPTPATGTVSTPEGVRASALLAVNMASMSDAQIEGLLAELDDLDASLSVEPRPLLTVPAPDGGEL